MKGADTLQRNHQNTTGDAVLQSSGVFPDSLSANLTPNQLDFATKLNMKVFSLCPTLIHNVCTLAGNLIIIRSPTLRPGDRGGQFLRFAD